MNPPEFLLPLPASQSVVRPEDLLVLRFTFVNLRLTTVTAGQRSRLVLTRADPAQPAWLDVQYPPQSVAEQTFDEPLPNAPSPVKSPVPWRLTQPSRLRFGVPADAQLNYSLAGLLLACQTLPPRLMATATYTPPAPGTIAVLPLIGDPTGAGGYSYVEAPYGLFLSPTNASTWTHAQQPVTSYLSQWTELWHSRLQHPAPDLLPTVRAIWSRDYASLKAGGNTNSASGLGALTAKQLFQLVERTSNFQLIPNPTPIQVNALALSALGAWLDVRGNWEADGHPELLLEWRHRAALGRDHYVQTVEQGYLWPFGHTAALVTITERKFETESRQENGGDGLAVAVPIFADHRIAVLRRRQYLVVREPVKEFPALSQPADTSHQLPFRRVRITTRVTPPLDAPKTWAFGVPAAEAFYPQVNQQDFRFHLELTDAEGQRADFGLPLAFVAYERAYTSSVALATAYRATPPGVAAAAEAQARRHADLRQQSIAFAPALPGLPGNTTLDTSSLALDVALATVAAVTLKQQRQAPFYPVINSFKATVPALKYLLGDDIPVDLVLSAPNAGGVFAELPNAAKRRVAFSPEQGGGLVTPNFGFEGLSREFGPVGDIKNLKQGKVDFQQLFADVPTLALPQLFGLINLRDVLPQTGLLDGVPRLLRTTLPDQLTAKLLWKTPLREWHNLFIPLVGNALQLDATFTTPLTNGVPAPGQSNFIVTSRLSNFALNFLDVIRLEFNSLTFEARSGKKADLSVDLRSLVFLGPLAFLDKLRALIPLQGFIDPPNLDVTAKGITAGYTLALPSVEVGAFALQNLSVGAAFSLPLLSSGPPSVRFAFCERQSPFLITVAIFAGGGFFALAVSPHGVETLEVALEFGGNIALNLGVASGGVYVLAGIYFRLEVQTGGALLEGYLRCGGSLRVLGLVTVSVEFYMGLCYDAASGKALGRATVKVKVKVLFFSKSVSLTTERRFSGSTGDPFFEQTTTPAAWATYCDAFAA